MGGVILTLVLNGYSDGGASRGADRGVGAERGGRGVPVPRGRAARAAPAPRARRGARPSLARRLPRLLPGHFTHLSFHSKRYIYIYI